MIHTQKKIRKFWIFFVEKSEILGGFYLQKKKRVFSHKKKKTFCRKSQKKCEKISADPQMFSGDKLDIKGLNI